MEFDEINPAAILLAVVGFFIAIFTSNSMGASGVGKVVTGLIVGVACYFLSSFIINSG